MSLVGVCIGTCVLPILSNPPVLESVKMKRIIAACVSAMIGPQVHAVIKWRYCVCASIITLHCVSVSDDDDDDGVIPLDDKARKRAALATGGKNLHMNEDKNQIP